ncbi:MAG TPA: hypothetical protein PKA88_11890 [Polyangiaceae bacterium]|mgnify:CR=1 FL=1|nr:hypothetical protein [Polyangiaceae bacterium]
MKQTLVLVSLVLIVACDGGDGGGGGTAGTGGNAGGAGAGGGSTGGVAGSGTGGVATGGAAGSGAAGQAGGGNCLASDTMSWAGTSYHETQSTTDPAVCDPQIMAAAYTNFATTGAPGINILLHYEWDASAKKFGNFVSMNLNGVTTGDYPHGLGAMQSSVIWNRPGGNCIAGGGSVTLSQYDGIGGLAVGSFSFTGFTAVGGGATCPTSVDGSFSMSVVDGDQFAP